MTASLSSRLCRTPQIMKDRKDRNTDRRYGYFFSFSSSLMKNAAKIVIKELIIRSSVHREDRQQSRNSTSHTNSKRMVGNGGLPGMLETEIIPSPSTLRINSRISSESVPASRIKV